MKLNKIVVEKFKCFEKEQSIEFGKLTLLTGANSSGKSSILYSILGSIQSGEFPFQFSTNGKYVNMGDFKEIIFNHKRTGKIKLAFEFNTELIGRIETVWTEDKNNNLPQLFELKVTSKYFNINVRKEIEKFIVDFDYDPKKDPTRKGLTPEFLLKLEELVKATPIKPKTGDKSKESNKEVDFKKYFDELNSPQNIKGLEFTEFPPSRFNKKNEIGIQRLNEILAEISKVFLTYDNQINFISSFRLHPDRTYLEQSKSKLKVNNFGDGYLDQIISWENKKNPKFKKLISILNELSLLESIKTKRLEGGRFEISVKVKKGGVDTSLSDVGFGISQFLPIIVADLQLSNGSTLFIAQPEIHLHPSVQSSFGDYLTKQIITNSKNYIIETHSEYLINKIRLAVVKGELKEEDVSILFIDNHSRVEKIFNISFTKSGQILNAPSNFFKTYMMDVMDIAINAA